MSELATLKDFPPAGRFGGLGCRILRLEAFRVLQLLILVCLGPPLMQVI